MTSPFLNGRVLGQSRDLDVENLMTFFYTGNGATISPDLRRRVFHVDLFLQEARAEDRIIDSPLDDGEILKLRSEILSSLWTLVKAWSDANKPPPKVVRTAYERWSFSACGILEHAGFASPCTSAPTSTSGDRDADEMEKLARLLAERATYLSFSGLVDLCRRNDLFIRLVGEDDQDFDRGKKNVFSRILSRFSGRRFAGIGTFHAERPSKDTTRFYVD